MSELISRQAAIDLVNGWFKRIGLNGDICVDGLRQLPSAQPKIVRCKDCKNYKFGMCLYSMTSGVGKLPNGFCDWAERSEVMV